MVSVYFYLVFNMFILKHCPVHMSSCSIQHTYLHNKWLQESEWLVNYGHKDCILRRIQSTFFHRKLKTTFINLLSCIKLKEESSSAFCFFWEQDFIKRDLKLPPCKIGTELGGRNPENSWKVIEEMYFDMLGKKIKIFWLNTTYLTFTL